MSRGLVLNHLSASGAHTVSIKSGQASAANFAALVVTGAAAFGTPTSGVPGTEVLFSWPGSDTTFFVSGSVASDASATSFGTVGNYDAAAFGGNLHISGAITVVGSIRGGLEAKNANAVAATPVATQVAFWTSNLFLSGTNLLKWDDSDLTLGGNLQIQGSTTAISSSQFRTMDSTVGLGFSGSETHNNVGQRSLLFGRGTTGALLPALTWDGTRAYTIGVPASPSSGTIALTYGGIGLSGKIPIPAYDSGVLTPTASIKKTYGEGQYAKALVFPVAHSGVIHKPAISGTIDFLDGSGTYQGALFTPFKLHAPQSDAIFGGVGSDDVFRSKTTQNGEHKGRIKVYADGNGYNGGELSAFSDGQIKLSAGSGIELSGSNGVVEMTGSMLRSNYDNQGSLGVAAAAWSDLFLGSGAVIGINSDIDSGVKITHNNSATSLTLSGTLNATPPTATYGSFSTLAKASSITGPNPLTTSTTVLTSSAAFDSTDVSQMAAGNVIKFSGGGNQAFFLISQTPALGGTLISGSADNLSQWSSNSFGISYAYERTFTTSRTPGIDYTIGRPGTAWSTVYVDKIDLNGAVTTGSIILDTGGGSGIGSSEDDVIDWFIGNISTSKFFMNASGFFPKVDDSYDLGKATKRYRNIYTGDVNLRNDRGDWTLIEEDDFISFRNNLTGRRFRMAMEDITGMGNYGPGNDGEM